MVRSVRLALVLFAVGCSDPGRAPDASPVGSERGIAEGTPDALGVLAFLNDASTTLVVLDEDAGLDRRAATNLIAHRDGPDGRSGTADDDLFGTIAEVDAVSYVGDAALSRLVAYAQDGGWVPTDDGVYGVIEGVEFTVAEAAAVVQLANSASVTTLDLDVGLDARAARGIVDRRPFSMVEQVAAVSYVGASALRSMIAYTVTGPDAVVSSLEQACDGLWFTSESDYRMTVWTLPEWTPGVTVDSALGVLAGAVDFETEGVAVEASDLGWMFDRYTVPQSWWEPEQHADAARWQAVRDVFEADLTEVQVLRIGRPSASGLVGAIDVFVLGRAPDGTLVGIHTVSVET